MCYACVQRLFKKKKKKTGLLMDCLTVNQGFKSVRVGKDA